MSVWFFFVFCLLSSCRLVTGTQFQLGLELQFLVEYSCTLILYVRKELANDNLHPVYLLIGSTPRLLDQVGHPCLINHPQSQVLS